MALQQPTARLTGVIAAAGDFVHPAATAAEAGAGHLSIEKGWDVETQTPVEAGGVPPFRTDFNGLANLFSQFLMWYQSGGIMFFDGTLDYMPGCEVFHAGQKWRCLQACGPSTQHVVFPQVLASEYWRCLDEPEAPRGAVMAFYNCRVGGSDGRRLIPWGSNTPREEWVLCDGGEDGTGGTVPDLRGRCIVGAAPAEAGVPGGASTATTAAVMAGGTVEGMNLTIEQIPGHRHEISCSEQGWHTHGRGSMEITGTFPACVEDQYLPEPTGAFFMAGPAYEASSRGNRGSWLLNFAASRNWTGVTEGAGSHTHQLGMGFTGGGKPHGHAFTPAEHSHGVTLPLPPHYKLAYFVKVKNV